MAYDPQNIDPERKRAIQEDLDRQYREKLGRPMDERERESEYENYEKYGGEQIRKNLEERAAPTASAGGRGGDDDLDADGRIDEGRRHLYTPTTSGGQDVKIGSSRSPFDNRGSPHSAYQQYLSGGSPVVAQPSVSQTPVATAMPVAPQPDPLLEKLVAQLEADRSRQDTERAETRQLIMSQLGDATKPVSADDPALRPIINAQNLALQRGSQRQRSALAEQMAVEGLGDSGAMRSGIGKIEQARGEGEAGIIAQILQNELGAKRQQVGQLLDMAMQSGDAESARTLQGQLATLDQQMTQGRFGADLGFRNRTFDADLGLRNRALDVQQDQFGRDLGFRRHAFDEGQGSRRYEFDNDLAYRLAQLQLQGNLGSMGFLGGLL